MAGISEIYPSDRRSLAEVDALLASEGIRRDPHLDYICALRDDDGTIIATGSAYKSTLRCFAVSDAHQGEGLLGTVLSHLMEHELMRGYASVSLYTKPKSAKFFGDLGFYEIARVDGLVFMENDRNGFANCLARFERETAAFCAEKSIERPATEQTAAIVMNANPLTLGHRALVERAAQENALVHLFLVSEDASFFPYRVRKELVQAGISDFENVVLHASGPYIISRATFPSYFLKDAATVSRTHAALDIAVFEHIAKALGIGSRYIGEEPFSETTAIYNDVMQEALPKSGVACIVVPRYEVQGQAVSASDVRERLKEEDFSKIAELVPEGTLKFLESKEAQPIIEKLKAAEDVRHH